MAEPIIENIVDDWSKFTIDKWKAQINKLNIGQTGALYDSLSREIVGSGENVQKIRFTFNDYGIYVNYGVGRGIARGNKGDLGFTPERKKKRWFSNVIYRETHVLAELLAGKIAKTAIAYIINSIEIQAKEKVGSLISPKTR
jgi:hypothetical protein